MDSNGAATAMAATCDEKISPSISLPNTASPSDAGSDINAHNLNDDSSSSLSLRRSHLAAASAIMGAIESAIGEINAGTKLKSGIDRLP